MERAASHHRDIEDVPDIEIAVAIIQVVVRLDHVIALPQISVKVSVAQAVRKGVVGLHAKAVSEPMLDGRHSGVVIGKPGVISEI